MSDKKRGEAKTHFTPTFDLKTENSGTVKLKEAKVRRIGAHDIHENRTIEADKENLPSIVFHSANKEVKLAGRW
jgi:hypothetical protein